LDFAVEGDVVALVSTLVDRFGGACHEFTNFGGVHWVISETLTLDFTQCRKEQYTSFAALPIVSRTHIDGDLYRRDFNINAMALALTGVQFGLFIDPFMGLQSLESKEIHTLHSMSFLEDPTRIFRASRYCARFNMRLSDSTTEQLQHALATIQLKTMLTLQRVGIELEKIFKETTPSHAWTLLQKWSVWTQWQPHWNSISLHNTTTLSIQPTREEWTTCWWMQLCLALPMEERTQWKDIVSIRSNGLKLWNSTPAQIHKMTQALSKIDRSKPEAYIQTGLILQRSTLLHWLLISINYPEFLELLYWWVNTGRHRNRVTTGQYLLALNVKKGPMMAELLQVAQNVAWSGGDEEAEKTAIQSHIHKKTSPS
jgi:tRNA nucleotidyltransferase/poly(A) polymerase